MASVTYGGVNGGVYYYPSANAPVRWGGYTFTGNGGKKLASVSVADLFEVYPELAPNGYKTWLDEDENKDAEQDFAKNILLAAEHNVRKKALKSLPKIKNNKEDK